MHPPARGAPDTSGQDPDNALDDDDTGSWAIDMAMYAIEFAQARRAAEPPRDDLTTLHARRPTSTAAT